MSVVLKEREIGGVLKTISQSLKATLGKRNTPVAGREAPIQAHSRCIAELALLLLDLGDLPHHTGLPKTEIRSRDGDSTMLLLTSL